jgi:hypothetical protein
LIAMQATSCLSAGCCFVGRSGSISHPVPRKCAVAEVPKNNKRKDIGPEARPLLLDSLIRVITSREDSKCQKS